MTKVMIGVAMGLCALASLLRAGDEGISIPKVAQKILEGEGYRLFHYATDKPSPLVMVATLDGAEDALLKIPASKEVVMAIQLGQGNSVLAIHAYYAGGSAIRRYSLGYREATFSSAGFESPVELGKVFMALWSEKGELNFRLEKR